MVTDSRNAAPPARIAMHRTASQRKRRRNPSGETEWGRSRVADWRSCEHCPCCPESKRKFSIGSVRGDINANSVEYVPCRSQFLQTPQELVEFVGGVEIGFQLA